MTLGAWASPSNERSLNRFKSGKLVNFLCSAAHHPDRPLKVTWYWRSHEASITSLSTSATGQFKPLALKWLAKQQLLVEKNQPWCYSSQQYQHDTVNLGTMWVLSVDLRATILKVSELKKTIWFLAALGVAGFLPAWQSSLLWGIELGAIGTWGHPCPRYGALWYGLKPVGARE